MKLYHVATNSSTAEIEVLRAVKPPRILISYFYFKNKPVQVFLDQIGYRPEEIVLDSGAYSAFTKGKNISPIDYMKYIEANKEHITGFYISLDVIQDPELTMKFYEILRLKGFEPMPVFHYGDDERFLKYYLQETNHIALGNTVPYNKKIVSNWIDNLSERYPGVRFHLLGSSSRTILENPNIHSADSSTWILQALNGKPKHIPGKSREAKIERAIHNMRMELFEFCE